MDPPRSPGPSPVIHSSASSHLTGAPSSSTADAMSSAGARRSREDSNGPSASNGNNVRRKRAKIGTKITRNRKITSCLPCRERKQKCDRTHPICQKCIDDGRKCIYVDNESIAPDSTAAGGASASDERRPRGSEDDEEYDELAPRLAQTTSTAESERVAFIQKRRHIIAATWTAGRNRHLDFEARVRAARAAAVAEVLFAENGGHDLKVYGTLKLPTRAEAQMLLQYYQDDVQGFTNIVLVDLNRARIGDFLDWWHSNPITLPAEADAPLAPLVLCILALCLQAKRTRDALAKAERGDKSNIPQDGHCLSVIPSVSSERFLLETAGRCINALQIACPSSWASAYSAPLDIVRAETLRGIWHLGECHLQFASSTLNVALRLAYAAGLHRDAKHWGASQMSEFEAQARRSMWWNLAYQEVFHSHRTGQPSSISVDAADTELPLGFSAIAAQFKASGFPQSSLNQLSFDCFVARFYLTKLFLDHGASVFGLRRKPAQVVRDLEAIYVKWEQSLPEHLLVRMDNLADMLVAGTSGDTGEEEPIWQLLLLQISRLQGCISVHRPYGDVSSGVAKNRAASRISLEKCLDAASRLINLCLRAMGRRPGPPFLWLNIISYHTFNAGCLVAIHLVSGSEFAGLCSAAYRDSLAVLDNLADKRALHNVSEQAERYAAAIREIAATPGKFHVKGGERAGSRGGSYTRSPSSAHADGQRGESTGRTVVHRSSHPNASLPLRVGRTSPPMGGQEDLEPDAGSAAGAMDVPPPNGHPHGGPTWSSEPAREGRLPPMHSASPSRPPHSSPTFVENGGPTGGGVALSFDPPTVGSSSDSSVEDFFTKQRAVTSLTDRPLPGANQLHFGSLGPLLTDDVSGFLSPSAVAAAAHQADQLPTHAYGGAPSYPGPSQGGSAVRRSADGGSAWHPENGPVHAPNASPPNAYGHGGSPPWRGDPPALEDHLRSTSAPHSLPGVEPLFVPSGPSVLHPPPSSGADYARSRLSHDHPGPPLPAAGPSGYQDGHQRTSSSHGRFPGAGGALPPASHESRSSFPTNSSGGTLLPPLGGPQNYQHHPQPPPPPMQQQQQQQHGPHHHHHHHHHPQHAQHYQHPAVAAADQHQPMEEAAAGLGQVDWFAWENFITKVLQDS